MQANAPTLEPPGPQALEPSPPRYIQQHSTQTLRDGIAEYYACNPGLLDPEGMPERVRQLFRQHDAGHVVFGCDTSLRGEALIDSWTIFATTVGFSGYLEYLRYPQVNQIFRETGYLRIAVESIRCLPDIGRALWRSRKMKTKWPWAEYECYLDRPLREIRDEFDIRLL
jgi:hypothetical protein